ncbi:MAG: bifunctional phosphoserine phosphatase/homoserine phosphotransferase ThrH [Deltaproteobacteria bacterium]|nr:bifunctional phosphoserine phosphatase/homoserine phosphotransferase ThrH [Deltaproteobacteria bacterium]
MIFFCSDVEGVWIPEVWISVAVKTRIDELKLTTRDLKDYDQLMRHRIKILKEHKLTLTDIQQVISTIQPLDGAVDMLNWIRSVSQIAMVSDTFTEFATPLMARLGWPTLYCNYLTVDEHNMITGYHLRQPDQKKKVVKALKSLNYTVVAFGDSYNDINMLKEAHQGILFRPPQKVKDDFPQFPVAHEYTELKKLLEKHLE